MQMTYLFQVPAFIIIMFSMQFSNNHLSTNVRVKKNVNTSELDSIIIE